MSGRLLAFQISTTLDMISDALGYLDGAIRDEGFIADGSYSDLRMLEAERRLRQAADAIAARHKALMENAPMLQAAE